MTLKKSLYILLAVLMVVSLCVPAAATAAWEEYCTCDAPWAENPQPSGEPYIYDSDADCHTWAQDYVYDCTQCGLPFYETDTWDEGHYGYVSDYQNPDGSIVKKGTCEACGEDFVS